jgi:hypothetical protein
VNGRLGPIHPLIIAGLLLLAGLALFAPLAFGGDADTPEEAVELPINQTVKGAIESPGDIDWFWFNVTSANTTLVIETFNMSFTMDTVIYLYANVSQTAIAVDDDGGDQPLASKIVYTFQEPGIYYVRVVHYDRTLGVGHYYILVRPPKPPSVVVSLIEPGVGPPRGEVRMEVFEPVNYTRVGYNVSDAEGVIRVVLPDYGYYMALIGGEGYHDYFTIFRVSREGDNLRTRLVFPVDYTGRVATTAWVAEPVEPGVRNTLQLTFFNINDTYPLILKRIEVVFPWFGFYEGGWEGNYTIQEGLPILVTPRGWWTYSLSFTPPPDARGMQEIGPAYVAFYVEVPVWRATGYIGKEGPAINFTLTTVELDPFQHQEQGFIAGILWRPVSPVSDPETKAAIESLELSFGDMSQRLDELAQLTSEGNQRLEELAARFREVAITQAENTKKLGDLATAIDQLGEDLSLTIRGMASDLGVRLRDIGKKEAATGEAVKELQADTRRVARGISDLTEGLKGLESRIEGLAQRLDQSNQRLASLEAETANIGPQVRETAERIIGDLAPALYALIGLLAALTATTILLALRQLRPLA